MEQQSFAQRLYYLLTHSQLPISRLADELSISRQSIYNWLGTNTISQSSLQKLATYFDVSQHWLRYGNPINKPSDKSQHSISYDLNSNKEQTTMTIVKTHLSAIDILIGSYFFKDEKIHWLGSNHLITDHNGQVPKTINELLNLLKPTELKQLKQHLIKMRKAHHYISQQFICRIDDQKILCTLFLLKGKDNAIEGVTFNIQRYLHSKTH